MREIGRAARIGARALDGVAHRAGGGEENFPAALLLGSGGLERGFALRRSPCLVVVGLVRDDEERHLRVLHAAEFGALAAVGAGVLCL